MWLAPWHKNLKKGVCEYFLRYFFPAFVGKKHNYNILEILRRFSVENLGLICVWALRFFDKNPDNFGNFFYNIFLKLEINFTYYIIKYLYQYFLFLRRNIE